MLVCANYTGAVVGRVATQHLQAVDKRDTTEADWNVPTGGFNMAVAICPSVSVVVLYRRGMSPRAARLHT